MDTIKDRNGKDLREAEKIKKRWQEYTEELYKKDFNDPDNHNDVITHLELDILEVKSSRPSYLPLLFSGTLHSAVYIFPFLPCLSLLFFPQLFVKLPQTITLHSCISFSFRWF